MPAGVLRSRRCEGVPMGRLAAALLLLLAALSPGGARAQDQGAANRDAIGAAIASGNYDRVRQGIDQLATSGDPRAADMLGALQAGKLYVGPGQALFIKTDAGIVAADNGTPAPDVAAGALKPVRVNNPVRNAIAAALGGLRLFSPDPALRLQAAESVFQSHDPDSLPALDRALAKETDPAVKQILEQARAASVLFAPDTPPEDRLAAIAVLRERGDLAARSLLANAAAEKQPDLVAAASSA